MQVALSERNTVELIIKLKELGFIGSELLHTTNGKEYVTKGQLEKELHKVLEEQGGRLPLVDLPGLLGIDLGHCQNTADALALKFADEVILAQGEIFSSLYFEDMAVDIERKLQESGVLALGAPELAPVVIYIDSGCLDHICFFGCV